MRRRSAIVTDFGKFQRSDEARWIIAGTAAED
jgi:hypothetical protein